MIRITTLLFVAIFFIGCAQKVQYASSKSYAFVIKNSEFAIADTGFIKYAPEKINLQIYKTSEPIFELDLGKDACIEGVCLKKEEFNRRFFGYRHYPELMEEILRKKPIYNGKNKEEIKEGFRQIIKTKKYDLLYRVTQTSSYLKDRKNRILLKLKELH